MNLHILFITSRHWQDGLKEQKASSKATSKWPTAHARRHVDIVLELPTTLDSRRKVLLLLQLLLQRPNAGIAVAAAAVKPSESTTATFPRLQHTLTEGAGR